MRRSPTNPSTHRAASPMLLHMPDAIVVALLLAVLPFVVGIVVTSFVAPLFDVGGRLVLVLVVIAAVLLAWFVLGDMGVFGYDRTCTDECWNNIPLVAVLLFGGLGSVIAGIVACGVALRDERNRGTNTRAPEDR